jgi:hypothetical protein
VQIPRDVHGYPRNPGIMAPTIFRREGTLARCGCLGGWRGADELWLAIGTQTRSSGFGSEAIDISDSVCEHKFHPSNEIS